MKLLIYSTFAFILYVLLGTTFATILYPVPESKTVTVQKTNETLYYFTPEDHMITSKFYNDEGYFLVVYNEDSKDFDIKEVEEDVWESKRIDKSDYYDKYDY